MSLLPIELYRPIIEEVSRNDLFSFLRVSPPFRLEAERHIYRKLSLGPADDVVLRCHFLILNPRILVHSQTLDIRLEAWKKGTSKRHPYHRLLAAVLEQAINLKSLTIRGTPGRYIEWRGAGQLFKACAFKLHTLRCHYPMEAEFAMFLDKQTDLKEFQWWSFATASVKLQVDALPRLSILRVQGGENIGIASQLISGSSLTHLSWKYDFHFSLCHLSLSGARLKSLEVDPLDVATLIPISTLFPELEYLAIVKYRSYIDVVLLSSSCPALEILTTSLPTGELVSKRYRSSTQTSPGYRRRKHQWHT
jgi:hypothetical protein